MGNLILNEAFAIVIRIAMVVTVVVTATCTRTGQPWPRADAAVYKACQTVWDLVEGFTNERL